MRLGKLALLQHIILIEQGMERKVRHANYLNLYMLSSLILLHYFTGEDVLKTTIIVADCSDQSSLDLMARQGKVIINCCGPYRLFGEPVVKACIENGTHHLDVSGEPEVNYCLFRPFCLSFWFIILNTYSLIVHGKYSTEIS